MENAARALLMAGGVLIAIALLTFFVYLFRQTGDSTKSIYSMLEESEITEFNQQFYNYDTERSGKILTVQDVSTLINLVQDANTTQKMSTHITIKVNGYDYTAKDAYADWLNEKVQEDTLFECKVDTENKLVNKITITTKS